MYQAFRVTGTGAITKEGQPILCVGLYEAQPRKADGVLTWRLVSRHGKFMSRTKAETHAQQMSKTTGIPFNPAVKQNTVVSNSQQLNLFPFLASPPIPD